MKTIQEYVKNYGSISFDESPINDIDSLIFSELTYLDFQGIIPGLKKGSISLEQAAKKFFKKFTDKDIKKEDPLIRKVIIIFKQISETKRYSSLRLSNYQNIIEPEKQFGAFCIRFTDQTLFVAFEGTDDTIIGWKEDFNMLYEFPVPAQKNAISYFNQVTSWKEKKIIVGGHSKGGNLAMCAAMYGNFLAKRKIDRIYNFDGPGFRTKEYESIQYQRMEKKLKTFVPEACIVGMLMNHSKNYTIVKSSGKGFYQHDGLTWECYGPFFIESTQNDFSIKFGKRVNAWLKHTNDEKRKKTANAIFNLIESSGITLFSQIRRFQVLKILSLAKESINLDKESKDILITTFKAFLLEPKNVKEKETVSVKE